VDDPTRAVGGEGYGAVRRLIRAARLLIGGVALACASQGVPPGGPPDEDPPELVSISPDSGSVNVKPKRVVFNYNEVVSERPQGAPSLEGLVLISPRDGEARVSWKRDHIEVRPRRGWRPNTVYIVQMLPGLNDLRNNARKEGSTTVFSTGPTIPNTALAGIVFDWVTGRVAPNTLIQAFVPPDTLVPYVVMSDSGGRFSMPHLPPGTYAVRAVVDANNNRGLDTRELWDSATVRLADSSRVELLAFIHDTIGPRIESAEIRDSVTVRVVFDKALALDQRVDPSVFKLQRADSTVIPIVGTYRPEQWDSLQKSEAKRLTDSTARADSIRADSAQRAQRLADTTRRAGARPDTIRRPPVVPPLPPRVGVDTTAEDSLADAAPRPSRPIPIKEVVLRLGAPLEPGKPYRLHATNVRNLLARPRTSFRVINVPKRPAADSTSLDTGTVRGRGRTPAGRAGAPGQRLPGDSTTRSPAPSPVRPPTRPPELGERLR
jgi:hypothetical protein